MTENRTQIAFRLSQLGTIAAEQFGERVAALGVSRSQAGLLRLIGRQPGQSQRAVATQLGMPPSRLVALLDDLEQRDLVERRRSADDRRNYELHLAPAGERLLRQLGRVAAQHEAAVTAGLDDAERARLDALLARLADHHELAEGVHPGYRTLGRS